MLAALLLAALLQEGTLDVLDGETLFEDGVLFTVGAELENRQGLRDGSRRVSDPLDRTLTELTYALSAHYGIRNDVQLSAILPWIDRNLDGGPDFSSNGPGDLALVAKWRFYRWDDIGKAANFAVLAGLEVPTGEDDERSGGVRLPPELQPGSGSWDPSLGLAATYEPGRWRFNAAALYARMGRGDHDYSAGDQLFVELAAGNRFWLEPYPGPFMRFDLLFRYRREDQASLAGRTVEDTGGDVFTAGATLAFRPRPSLDFQVFVEWPFRQDLNGLQLERDLSILFVFGYRL